MGHYKLTCAADADFENIFSYGIDQFGLDQAVLYQRNLKRRFEELSEQPELYPAVEHLLKGLRRSVYHAHSIYYRTDGQGVVIVRILGHQDIRGALK